MKISTFKLSFVIPALILICLSSCKKEEETPNDLTFENLSRSEIVSNASKLSDENIVATNATGHILNDCDVIVFKTNDNRYGKMKIIDMDDGENLKLTIRAVSYNDDGSVFKESDHLEIRGTYNCDLDLMLESGTGKDFHWARLNDTDTRLDPKNAARFAKY